MLRDQDQKLTLWEGPDMGDDTAEWWEGLDVGWRVELATGQGEGCSGGRAQWEGLEVRQQLGGVDPKWVG